MSNAEEPLEDLKHIRSIMERSSRFISLSGLSGVFAGFFALAGVAAFYIYMNKNLNYGYSQLAQYVPVDISLNFKRFVILDAAVVAILSIAFAIYFTTRNARSKGQTIWDKSAKRMLINLAIPLVAGGTYCLVLLYYGWFGLVAPSTLIFYGIALVSASNYTLDEIRWLGISQLVMGMIGCFCIGYGMTLWAIGFGVLHIIYGLLMYSRYEAKPKEKKYW